MKYPYKICPDCVFFLPCPVFVSISRTFGSLATVERLRKLKGKITKISPIKGVRPLPLLRRGRIGREWEFNQSSFFWNGVQCLHIHVHVQCTSFRDIILERISNYHLIAEASLKIPPHYLFFLTIG